MVRHLTTRLALASAGAGLAIAGFVLLLRAVWIAIALPLGAMWASTIMGGVLLVVGVLVVSLLAVRSRQPGRSDSELIVTLTTAFLQGLSAGRSAQRH